MHITCLTNQSDWAHIYCRKRKYPQRIFTYILHRSSGDMYLREARLLTKIKCAMVAITAFAVFGLRFASHVKNMLTCSYYLIRSHCSNPLGIKDASAPMINFIKASLDENIALAVLSIVTLLKTIFWGCVGAIHPWDGRREIAHCEQAFNTAPHGLEEIRDESYTHAKCFRCLGNVNDTKRFYDARVFLL